MISAGLKIMFGPGEVIGIAVTCGIGKTGLVIAFCEPCSVCGTHVLWEAGMSRDKASMMKPTRLRNPSDTPCNPCDSVFQLPFALIPILTFTSLRPVMSEFSNGM